MDDVFSFLCLIWAILVIVSMRVGSVIDAALWFLHNDPEGYKLFPHLSAALFHPAFYLKWSLEDWKLYIKERKPK